MSGRGPRGGDRGGRGGDRGGRGRGGDRGGGRGRGRGDGGERGSGFFSDANRGNFGPGGRGRGRDERGGYQGGRPQGGNFQGGNKGGGYKKDEKTIFRPGQETPPDAKVKHIEDQTEKDAKAGMPKMSQLSIAARFPQRPAFGTKGKPVTLWANYMQLLPTGQQTLFRYNIELLGDGTGAAPVGKKCGRLIDLLLEENFPDYRTKIATDFRSTLVSSVEVPFSEELYNVTYRAEGEDEPSARAKTYRARIQSTGTLTMTELINYLTSSNAGAILQSKEEVIQALNIILGHYPKSSPHIMSLGANKHYPLLTEPRNEFSLGSGLNALRGFFVSVRAATGRLLVNVQVKNTPCYQQGPLRDMIRDFQHGSGNRFSDLERFLKRVRVRVTHIPAKKNKKTGEAIPRIKTIFGLATPRDAHGQTNRPKVASYGASAKGVEFFLNPPEGSTEPSPASGNKKGKKGKGPSLGAASGGYISVADFFMKTYNIRVDNQLPVVNVGNLQNPVYLPVEVCEVVAGQSSNAKLNPNQTAQMIRFAVRKPADNAESIVTTGTEVIGVTPKLNPWLTNFNMSVVPKLITVPGRVLQNPSLKYGGKSVSASFGSWNMRDIKFTRAAALPSWSYIWITGNREPWRTTEELNGTLKAFTDEMGNCGLGTNNKHTLGYTFRSDPRNNIAQIDGAFDHFARQPSKPRLLLVILPNPDTQIYNYVKFVGDVKRGIHTVCVVGAKLAKQKFGKPDFQYFANVALKFNLKLGGANHHLDNDKLGIIAFKKTMVVGLDVTHPSPGSSSKAPSVAGIVASYESTLAQWPAEIRIQEPRQEMVSALDDLLVSRLRFWQKKNGNLPENILVYRDGISEGQYNITLEQEVPLLRKACEKLYSAADTKKGLPRISLIVVGKRHNTRFYATKEHEADKSSNPMNGTVVDRGVTEARNWDFFLQAHTALQGTARPAHYYVVLDEIFRKGAGKTVVNAADDLENLTHNMCYLFGRATKAVSVCPPAYYADLVCERARCYLSGLFDETSTPAASTAGSTAGGQVIDSKDVTIHPNLSETMFYL
ncbi:hypothetical protein FQN54_003667 [Arachnomyces sp. PD_36]|nr:hypothetical protein FQN54_003667 [Arachnomyces sp. PD_36]